MAEALGKRAWGSLARLRKMTSSSTFEMYGLRWLGGSGFSVK